MAHISGMLDPDEKNAAGLALTARVVFIIGMLELQRCERVKEKKKE